MGGWFLESGTDTHRLSTQVYISAYPSILKKSKNQFLVYNHDAQKNEKVKEPARDLSALSENLRFFEVCFWKLPQPIEWFYGLNFPGRRTGTDGCMILKHLKNESKPAIC